MKRATLRGLVALVAAIGFLIGVPSAASAAMVENTTHPLDFTQLVTCANGGAGEEVHVTGQFHTVFSVTNAAGGGTSIFFSGNSQNLSGVGLTTGDRYRGVDRFAQSVHTVAPPESFTETSTFKLIGQGPGNDLTARLLVHVTIDANGVLRSDFSQGFIDCG
jgi:hypothetical protein